MSKHLDHLADDNTPLPPPRLVFLDLDGTVINSTHALSAATIRAVKRLQKMGINVSLATGRPLFGAASAIEQLGITSPSLFYSGALVFNPASGKVLLEEPLGNEIVARIISEARKLDLYIELYGADRFFVERPSELANIHTEYLGSAPQIMDFAEVLKENVILKTVAVSDSPVQEQRLRQLAETFSQLNIGIGHGAMHPQLTFLNLTSPKASRERAFELLISTLNIKAEEAWSFGDGEADMVFLSKCGIGIAMDNANEVVKNAADLVTRHVDQDGVAYALERLVFSK